MGSALRNVTCATGLIALEEWLRGVAGPTQHPMLWNVLPL